MQVREKVAKSHNTVFFQWFVAPEGRKVSLLKRRGAEPCIRDEKLHAVVGRSTFPSQNVQNTPTSDHFWKLWCRKCARRCGAKHISKSKYTKHTRFGPLLKVQMCFCVAGARGSAPCQRFQKRWQAWDICRASAKMHVAWPAQYKRHVHQRC